MRFIAPKEKSESMKLREQYLNKRAIDMTQAEKNKILNQMINEWLERR